MLLFQKLTITIKLIVTSPEFGKCISVLCYIFGSEH